MQKRHYKYHMHWVTREEMSSSSITFASKGIVRTTISLSSVKITVIKAFGGQGVLMHQRLVDKAL